MGIPADRLSDDDLRHELLQLKKKQDDISRDGTPAQRSNHQSRTAELEAEFVQRFGSGDTGAAHDVDREEESAREATGTGGDAPGHDDSGAAVSTGTPSTETTPETREAGSHRAD